MSPMSRPNGLHKETNGYQISVPFTQDEWNRFGTFIDKKGLKKGRFAREAILEKWQRMEREGFEVLK